MAVRVSLALLAFAFLFAGCGKKAPPAPAPSDPVAKADPAPQPAQPPAAKKPATPEEGFTQLWREARDAGTAAKWFELGEWCEKNAFPNRAKACFEEGLKLDPDHEKSRAKLGYQRYTGKTEKWAKKKWLTAREVALAADEDAPPPPPNDPRLGDAFELYDEVRQRPGFRGFEFVWSLKGPYVLLIQKTDKGDEMDQWYQNSRGAMLNTLYDFFSKEFAEPAGFKRFEKLPGKPVLMPVVTFLSRKEFDRYHDRIKEEMPEHVRAYYDPEKKIIYSYEEEGGGSFRGRSNDNLNTLFHEGVHQLVDAFTKGEDRCQAHWFQEGFAEFIGSVERIPNDQTKIDEFRLMQHNPFRAQDLKRGDIRWYFKLEELLKLRNSAELLTAAFRMTKGEDLGAVTSIFYAQAWGLVHFFWYGADGKYRDRFRAYVKEELTGKSGLAVFKKVFGDPDLKALGEEWEAWCRDLANK
jgi:hypothetical protein